LVCFIYGGRSGGDPPLATTHHARASGGDTNRRSKVRRRGNGGCGGVGGSGGGGATTKKQKRGWFHRHGNWKASISAQIGLVLRVTLPGETMEGWLHASLQEAAAVMHSQWHSFYFEYLFTATRPLKLRSSPAASSHTRAQFHWRCTRAPSPTVRHCHP